MLVTSMGQNYNVGEKPTVILTYTYINRHAESPNICVKLQLRNRFIHVGVDISSYALLIGGRSSYPPVLVKFLYSRSVSISGLSISV